MASGLLWREICEAGASLHLKAGVCAEEEAGGHG